MKANKIIAVITARTNSTRLPGKVIKPLAGVPMLQRIVERINPSRSVSEIVLATTINPVDDELISLAHKLNIGFFRGSEEDVLGRIVGTVNEFKPDTIVCLTGDNPLIDPKLIDDMIHFYNDHNYDYISSTHMHHSNLWQAERTFPVGISVQIIKAEVIREVEKEVTDMAIRAHATLGVYNRKDDRYNLGAFQAEGAYNKWRHPELRLTVDTIEDYDLINHIFQKLFPVNPNFSTLDAIRLVLSDPSLKSINAGVKQRIAAQ
ncbi:cytidylyltransferase domain-containing protein [Thermodesulfobacteriota bacterium]